MSTYRDVADRFDLTISALHNVLTRVSDFLGDLAPEYIKWPTQNELEETKQFYLQKKGFPNVYGCVDGTHLKIDKPAVENYKKYYNRKDFYSIQFQIVCNHKNEIIDFFGGYPGSSHDAWVYANSPFHERLSNLEGNGYFLGDSAYPCSTKLLTPFRDNGCLNYYQKHFNETLSSCRVDVEHTIGIWKQRFRLLFHTKLVTGMRRLKIIRATCVLHNMCIKEGLHGSFIAEDDYFDPLPFNFCNSCEEDICLEDTLSGKNLRMKVLSNMYFSNNNL